MTTQVGVVYDRVRETSTTTGTGDITLAGAASGAWVAFSSVYANGDKQIPYCIEDQSSTLWEVGLGTYNSSGTTLTRNTVLSNSAGTTSKINFTSASLYVSVVTPALTVNQTPQIVTHNDLLAQTAAVTNILNYTTPNDGVAHTYQFNAYFNVTASTLDTLGFTFTFQDENNATQTFTSANMYSAAQTGYRSGFAAASAVSQSGPIGAIRAYPNTAITFSTTQTVTSGSISYDVGASLMRLY